LFSLLALFLTMLGIYAVLAELVANRVPEIGVRMALGATRSAIVRMVLSSGFRMVTVGVAVGLTSALLLRGVMTGLVFGVPTTDPLTYSVAAAGVMIAAFIACSLPARRAASIDPVVALRQE